MLHAVCPERSRGMTQSDTAVGGVVSGCSLGGLFHLSRESAEGH
jgi:hypothetical protein